MIFSKLKQIFSFIWKPQIPDQKSSTPHSKKGGEHSCDKIEAQIDKITREKELIRFFPLKITSLIQAKKNIGRQFNIYSPKKALKTRSLKELKEIRLKKEAEKREALKKQGFELLDHINHHLRRREADKAKLALLKVAEYLPLVNSVELEQSYEQAYLSCESIIEVLERENRQRLEEERKRREEEEKKKHEEQEKLLRLSEEKKLDWREFEKVLQENGVVYLYHFTDERNIPSIKKHGGLFSWDYCLKHSIAIPCQGGDKLSKDLDKRYQLEDYVRLSFCRDHPMAYRLKMAGSSIFVLKIKVDVAYLKNTLFSDINAADRHHQHGGEIDDLKRVNFKATKMSYLRSDDPNFKAHQAEVMVKTFIPLKYIVNIDEV